MLYWERFQNNKANHELSRGKVTTFSPIARFPRGMSIFHYYATNQQVIKTFEEAMNLAMQEKGNDDKRIKMMPLMFLHRHPIPNKQGHRITPLHVAIEKQSPQCFEVMLQLLEEQTSVNVTNALLSRLDDVINAGSPAVNALLDNSYRITEQLDGPRPLMWPG
jgi:hypothetical protein